ncbi:PrgI family protein [Candidatus Peribacteria bacterium]|nr:PrgI family protein [Candidatus Peribacteria bacterium]
MRFKVPQDIDREDKIFWFVSFRQLIYLLIGFFASYGLYTSVGKLYALNLIESVLLWFPLGIAAAFAFFTYQEMTLVQFILTLSEQLFFRPSRRYWQMGSGEPLVSVTQSFRLTEAPAQVLTGKEAVASNTIENLAALLDSHGTKSS